MKGIMEVVWRISIITLLLITGHWGVCAAQTTVDTFHVFFHLNDPALNAHSKTTLDSLIYNDVITTNNNILIVGYADYLGSEKYNKGLSEKRASSIKAYLLSMGLDKKKVNLCIGNGRVNRDMKSPEGFAPDRRVDVVILDRKKTPTANKQPIPAQVAPIKQTAAHPLDSLKKGQTMVLRNIYFYAGRHTVRKESLPELENLYNFMKDNPLVSIQIEGHICCVRTATEALDEDTFELALSENRAKFIYHYLARKGIEKWRLAYRGFGRTRPIVAVEKTEEDENKNRRVEIRIMDK